jgi:3-oxoacyl-[acyl-carrier-protein] synthase II
MALCAATEALADHARLPAGGDAADTGVVVSCNLGNLDTVCRVVDVLRAGSTQALSPMDLPKASSNIIASTLAIHFDCRGLNLMVCNGASSGLDALYLAAAAVRARRARRLLVVGVEPPHREAQRLLEDKRVSGGAAGVLVEAASSAVAGGARIYGQIGAYAHHHGAGSIAESMAVALARDRTIPPALWMTPETGASLVELADDDLWHRLPGGWAPRSLDLTARLGRLYGALGVFQCVAASLWLQKGDVLGGGRTAILTSGGAREGASSLVMRSHGDGRGGQ